VNVAEILGKISELSALVVGDICLDRWCHYDPATAEPSRETGIPRIGVVATETTPGAGGTIANNLVALGVRRVSVLGAMGDDGNGYELTCGLGRRGISAELMVKSPQVSTFTYTKLINQDTGVEDQPRVDFIYTKPLPGEIEGQLLDNFNRCAATFDAVLVSDQAETAAGGVVTPALREAVAAFALKHPEKIVWVDSRVRTDLFRHVILKPNQREAGAACLRRFGRIDYPALRAHVSGPLLIVTHGPDGVMVVDKEKETHVATRQVDHPVDICGAGDSFSAGAAMALAATRSPLDAARFGNMVASITIMKKGTGTASPPELLQVSKDWPE
jgi:rfaE bifunctional protein kinase chain/domain